MALVLLSLALAQGCTCGQKTAAKPEAPAPAVTKPDATTEPAAKPEAPKPDAPKPEAPKLETPAPGGFYVQRGESFRIGDIFLSGQPAGPDYARAKEAGVQSVINLRLQREHDALTFDPEYATKELGLPYTLIEVSPENMDDARAERLLDALDTAPRPVLVHDSNGNRAWALWVLYMGVKRGVSADESKAVAAKCGITNLVIEAFVRDYLKRKGKA
jgi:protein tyrosine phosphatase (PTP) superfamily phosphohydrolase (DUF442 family)